MIGLMMLAAATAITGDAALQRRIDHAPKSVHNLIERRAGCNYLAGEESGSDPERSRDLRRKARAIRCSALERDERRLRRSYAKRRDILALLTATADVIE